MIILITIYLKAIILAFADIYIIHLVALSINILLVNSPETRQIMQKQ